MKKAILIFGPSGVGKSYISKSFAEECNFLHYEADIWNKEADGWKNVDGIDLYKLRPEWDSFFNDRNYKPLYEILIDRAKTENKNGVVLSLPSVIVDTTLLTQAKQDGLHPVILYGSAAECIDAFLKREKETGRNLSLEHWIGNNFYNNSYQQMSDPSNAPFRIFAFDKGQWRSIKELIEEILIKIK